MAVCVSAGDCGEVSEVVLKIYWEFVVMIYFLYSSENVS